MIGIHSDVVDRRHKINLLLLEELKERINKYPNLRFGQIMLNTFFKNDTNERYTEFESKIYNEESTTTLAYIERSN